MAARRANIALAFAAIPPRTLPSIRAGGLNSRAFIAADLYLADNEAGFPHALSVQPPRCRRSRSPYRCGRGPVSIAGYVLARKTSLGA